MKRAAFVVVCLALAGCGDGEMGGGCSCASAVVWHGEVYLGHQLDGSRPAPPGEDLEGGIHPGCCSDDRPADLRTVGDVPPEVAVYVDGDDDSIYLSDRYAVFLPMPGYRRRARAAQCRVTGAISEVDDLRVRRGGRVWSLGVDGRTRFEEFPSPLPYLGKGDRVQVDAVGCRGQGLVARRIALQP
jgi:hypothetical protein